MLKQKTVPVLALLVLAYTTLCVLTLALTPNSQMITSNGLVIPGAPLKGVDVKLGRNPGGQARLAAGQNGDGVMVRTTDEDGKANFGVLPAGQYVLVLSFPEKKSDRQSKQAGAPGQRLGALGSDFGTFKAAQISLTGAVGGKVDTIWSFEMNKAVDADATRRAGKPTYKDITLEADGKSVVEVTVSKQASIIHNTEKIN